MNVIDSKNISYNVGEKLGEGSQGTTYLLEDGRHIVKLLNKGISSTEAKSKINFLINLQLDKNVYAVPLRQITQPRNGYIAEFASGMIPLSDLKNNQQFSNLPEWYFSTGGLRKRYEILIHLSALIRVLHSKGLAYCDLSPNNIFVSDTIGVSNIFLIDLDNVRYRTSLLDNIYTPFYGAPEIISSTAPNTPMSDCFSFAVIAYELLTLNHPLIGDYVNDGEPETEEQALMGKLPWVDHSTDLTNVRTTGLPSENVIPNKLLDLFKRNFENGLNNPFERPSMAEWFDALNLAMNELLKCGNNQCKLDYPYNNLNKCTFCGYLPSKVKRIQMRRWEEIEFYDKTMNSINSSFCLEPNVYDEILIDENTAKEIPAFNFLLTDIDPLAAVLKIEIITENNEDKLLLSPLKGTIFNISPRKVQEGNNKSFSLSVPQKIRVVDPNQPDKQKYMLHLNSLNTPQRVLTID